MPFSIEKNLTSCNNICGDVMTNSRKSPSEPLLSNHTGEPICDIKCNDVINNPDTSVKSCVTNNERVVEKAAATSTTGNSTELHCEAVVWDALCEMLDTVEIEVDMHCSLILSDYNAKRQSISSAEDTEDPADSRECKRARHDSTDTVSSITDSIPSDSSTIDNIDYNQILTKDTFNFCRTLEERRVGDHFPLKVVHRFLSSLYMTRRLKLHTELDYHSGCVNCLEFNRSGSLLVSGSDDLRVILWDWMNSAPALIFDSGHRGNIFQTRFVPYSNDCLIVTCAVDGQVRLAELSMTGECRNTRNLAKHNHAVHKLCIDKECGNIVLTCSEDAAVKMIDLRTNVSKRLLLVKNNAGMKIPLYSIALRPYKPYEFVLCGKDKYLRIFDRRFIQASNTLPVKKFCPEDFSMNEKYMPHVTSAVYNANGSEIISSYHDDSLYLFDADHSDGAFEKRRYGGHRNFDTVKGVNFYGSASEYIISGSDCGNIFIWDRDSTQIVWYDKGDSQGAVNVLEPHPTFPIIATSGIEHTVKIWYPSRQSATDLSNLGKVMHDNEMSRMLEDTRFRTVDREFIASLMRPLGERLRRYREQEDDRSSSSNEEYVESDASSDGDGDGDEPYAQIRCTMA